MRMRSMPHRAARTAFGENRETGESPVLSRNCKWLSAAEHATGLYVWEGRPRLLCHKPGDLLIAEYV